MPLQLCFFQSLWLAAFGYECEVLQFWGFMGCISRGWHAEQVLWLPTLGWQGNVQEFGRRIAGLSSVEAGVL